MLVKFIYSEKATKSSPYFCPMYSVDSIKRTVLLKVLFVTVSIKRTVFNNDFKKISIKNTVYQEKEVREKLNVRYV